MSKIINDFINCGVRGCGVGHFKNDALAVSCAEAMSSNQRRKFKRYGTVPAAFIEYLKRKKAIQEDAWVPERARTVHMLLDLLSDAPDKHRGVYSEGEMFRDAFLIEMLPELRNKMGSSQQVWHAFERDGKLHGLKGRGGTAKLPVYLQEN
jgi:hypothetical protein